MTQPQQVPPTEADVERAAYQEDVAMLSSMVATLKARCVEFSARLAATERALAEATTPNQGAPE